MLIYFPLPIGHKHSYYFIKIILLSLKVLKQSHFLSVINDKKCSNSENSPKEIGDRDREASKRK